MTTQEIINILENEKLPIKYTKTESIPMGRSIHFKYACSKDELSKKMLEKFGRDFNIYNNDEVCFFITNGTKLIKLNI